MLLRLRLDHQPVAKIELGEELVVGTVNKRISGEKKLKN